MEPQLAIVKTSKIVVVNDDSVQLKLLAGLLEKNGYAAAGFSDAATALERMSTEGPPDLIVTDLYMPRIDGWRFCRLLRSPEYKAFNQTPILVVSATFSGGEAAKITAELGANAFLPSPVRGAEFIEQVQRLLASEAPKFAPSVLIVEDTPSLSAMLVDFFQSHGYQADAALNGRRAREKFASTPYDLTLLDYHLPDALGDALLLEFQAQRPETVFVMTTGDLQPRLALEWMKLGASAYVRKPFDLEYLFALCENARRERALLRIPELLEQRTREMHAQEARFRTYLNNSADAVLVLDREGRRKFIFGAYESITGYTAAERLNKTGLDLHHTEDAPRIEKAFRDLMTRPGATVREEWRQRHKSGHWIWVEGIATSPVETGSIDGIVVNIRDITDRKLLEDEREQIAHLTLLLNTPGDFRDRMAKLTASLQSWSGCEAVGIRLRAGEDYPYFETRGFPAAFVQAENHLCACGQDGELLRDDAGNPVLECMCGNVLCGRFDPAQPFFTAHGSFWSNNTTALLASTTETDRQARTRNRCNGEGYESVALIPLRAGQEVFGLLQFNDHQPDRFTPGMISSFERIADNLALALSRRHAEAALRVTEARHGKMVANIGDVIVIIDKGGINRFKSPNIERWFGWKPEEVVGIGALDNVHPEDVDFALEFLGGLMREPNATGTTQCRYRCKDGSYKWIEFTGVNLLHDPDIQGILGNYHDITERKRADEALRESEIMLRESQTIAGLGSYVLNIPAGWWKSSNVLDHLFGIGETYARTVEGWGDLIHPGDRTMMLDYVSEEVIGKGRPFDKEYRIIRQSDQAERWVHGLGKLFLDAQGRPEYLRGTILDITERKQGEQEREKLQDQLLQAQKMESVGRLAGGVAHDFNNMLGVILGHVEMAIAELEPAHPLHADLEEVQKAAQRSADLTRQLLAFARKQAIAPKVLDLNATVAGMLKMIKRLIGEDIVLNWLPEAELWPIKMDPSQIDQILANLCVNARDAISGIGQLSIETGNSTFDADYCAAHAGFLPGEYVRLAVSDTGCGMDRETLARIFEPFFTTKGVGLGTGLGLATVYGVVKQNNGFINVYSEPGQGTTFSIYLPRHGGKVGQEQTDGAGKPALRGHETILLVEDEPAILKLATMMLERQGYTVRAASTPGEAIRLAREHSGEIHLLMTDVVMPEMNGRDLAKNLLTLYPYLKRLFMSGYTADVIAHHGVLDEGVYFIQKPFAMKDLSAKVREALDSE